MSELSEFRGEVKGWLAENCPAGARGEGEVHLGTTKKAYDRDSDLPNIKKYLKLVRNKVKS